MSKLNITVDLKEGMKIAPINEQDKKYTLVQSSKDKSMYALRQSHILKLDDVQNLDTDFICVDVSHFKEEVKIIQTENNNFYLIDNDFCMYSFIQNELDESYDDFQSVDMKILKMTREEYLTKKGFDYEFKCRDIIAEEYIKQAQMSKIKYY
jgi:hypothetical protein